MVSTILKTAYESLKLFKKKKIINIKTMLKNKF